MLGIDTSALVAFELKRHSKHDRLVELLHSEMDGGEEFGLTAQWSAFENLTQVV